MSQPERVLRAAEEFEAAARKHGLAERQVFGELLSAFEIAVARCFGEGVYQIGRLESLRLLREIHREVVKSEAQRESDELRRRAMTVVMARGRWNFHHTVNHLAELLLPAVPAPHEISAEIEGETENAG